MDILIVFWACRGCCPKREYPYCVSMNTVKYQCIRICPFMSTLDDVQNIHFIHTQKFVRHIHVKNIVYIHISPDISMHIQVDPQKRYLGISRLGYPFVRAQMDIHDV